jgi:uncharacterized protein YkwD
MKTIFHLAALAVLLASQGVQARSADVMQVVNDLRAPGGVCGSFAAALIPQRALDLAAARLARGASIEQALQSVAYRAVEAQVITLTGTVLPSQLKTVLADNYCGQIRTATLSEIGLFEGGNQTFIVLAAPFAPKLDMTRQQLAQRMLFLVNEARASPRRCGNRALDAARALSWNVTLADAASLRARDMAANNYFSHTGLDGSTFDQRVTRAGYRFRITGENIAAGQLTPEEAVAGWIKSPTHCANLMNGSYTEMGVAFAANADSAMGVYWVQLLGAPR